MVVDLLLSVWGCPRLAVRGEHRWRESVGGGGGGGGGGQSAETLQKSSKNMYKLSLPLP